MLRVGRKRNVQDAPVHVLGHHAIDARVRVGGGIENAQQVILCGGDKVFAVLRQGAAVDLRVELHQRQTVVGQIVVGDAAAFGPREFGVHCSKTTLMLWFFCCCKYKYII